MNVCSVDQSTLAVELRELCDEVTALRGEAVALYSLARKAGEAIDAALERIEPAPVAPVPGLVDLLREVKLAELVPALFDARGQMAVARLRTRLNQVLELRSGGVRNGGSGGGGHDYVARPNGGKDLHV
jgi:hypothetical protein